jgi:hypothetical protein
MCPSPGLDVRKRTCNYRSAGVYETGSRFVLTVEFNTRDEPLTGEMSLKGAVG